MDKIPLDITIEILSKLPLKSLTRFKIVSKEWHYVITNLVPVTDNPMALIQRCSAHTPLTFYCINHRGDEEIVSFPMKRNGIIDVHSSCKGLLLVQIHCDLFVWNPLTKFIKKVLICDALENSGSWDIAGLCYDNHVNKYKVVVATSNLSFIDQAFLVGTCGSNKLEQYTFLSKIENPKSGPYFREHIHWYYTSNVGSSVGFHPQQIVYFDPLKNQFIELPTPQPKDDNIGLIIGLGVLDGYLSITRSTNVVRCQDRIELLVMKEYGVGNSWEIMLIITDPRCLPCRFAVPIFKRRDSGAMVCIYDWSSGMVVYDTSGNVKDCPSRCHILDLVAYEECVTSPADELYWEDVEENFNDHSICFSTCPLSHTCAWSRIQI